MPGKILEIACFNIESALIAQSAGADRIELCEEYALGGITPSHTLIKKVREKISIPLHVIIRPRGGNFVYTPGEIKHMCADILFCKEQNIQGIVFGILTEDDEVDLPHCEQLMKLASPMSVTFHRAIDLCPSLDKSFSELIKLGINRVLTSGGKGNATENIQQLKALQTKFGSKIVTMPGGGIRSTNIQLLLDTNCQEFHSAAITNDSMRANHHEIENLKMLC